ncbi:MAG: hydroxymyristoyl-ACP dehydratase [Burkholderiaceae bacterium]|jgi:predicted hotdog family 3-hydroxylacyl-ACP dehydratase|nr:hydroxymyristoyl-ACP dehydratase [Burkholderiaceae bacterium]
MSAPATLDQVGIAQRIPHSGSMCLLERLEAWDGQHIHCVTRTHRLPGNPLRTEQGLMSPNAIEYAGQAMALHGGLLAVPGQSPAAGFIVSVRGVQLMVTRLDDIEGDLHVHAQRLSGDAQQVMYEFRLADAQGRLLAQGRVVAMLNTALNLN